MASRSYQRIRRLAVGGMGEITLARHLDTGKTVVLKTLLPQTGDNAAAARQFADEGRLMMLLRHPGIVQVLEVFEDHNEPVIAMEYIDGEALSVLLRAANTAQDHRVMPFVAVIAQVARALDAVHRAVDHSGKPLGLVHRDISPQNIMVARDGTAKLLDFGIAKGKDATDHTRTGVIKGKLAYVAPEQLSGQRADVRTDLYALGVVLWESVVGQRAFESTNELELLNKIVHQHLPAPTSKGARCDSELDAIVLKAVARDPLQRYQTAAELAQALEAYLAKHQHSAGEPKLGEYVAHLVGVHLDRRGSEQNRPDPAHQATAFVNAPSSNSVRITVEFPVAAESSLFEGLFRGVKLTEPVLADLKRIGVDPKRLESKYRVDVWARTIEVVRRHVYPDLPPDEASRRLGYDFSRGFEQTIGGRMVLALLPLLSVPTLLAKVPRFFKLGRPDIEISWTKTGPKTGTIRVKDIAQVSPFFDLGLIQYIIERMGSTANARVEWHTLGEFSIHYDW